MAVCRRCHQSETTLTPSKFPFMDVTNSNKSLQFSKPESVVKVKRDLSQSLKVDGMDIEN